MIRCQKIVVMFLFVIYGTSLFSQKENFQSFSFSNNAGCDNITFNYVNDRIYIPATIEDSIECLLFLDSGVKNVLLDSSFVARNKNKLGLFINTHPNYYTSIGGIYTFYQTLFVWSKNSERKQNQKIQIGNSVVFEEHPLVSNQRDDVGSGIFPLLLLAKDQIVNINVKERKMALLDMIDNKSDSISFEIDPYSSAPIINISILLHGIDTLHLIKGNFLLDLGFRGDLVLSESVLEKQLNQVPYQEYVYTSSSVKNVSTVKESYNISLDINNIHAKNTTIVYTKTLSPNIIGIIGLGILKHINFAVDYRECFFHYHLDYPSIQNPPYIMDEKNFGVNLIKQSSLLYIGKIRKGGKADILDVKLLDKVIQIDDHYVTKENCDLLFSKLPLAKKLVIQQNNGKNITLQK